MPRQAPLPQSKNNKEGRSATCISALYIFIIKSLLFFTLLKAATMAMGGAKADFLQLSEERDGA